MAKVGNEPYSPAEAFDPLMEAAAGTHGWCSMRRRCQPRCRAIRKCCAAYAARLRRRRFQPQGLAGVARKRPTPVTVTSFAVAPTWRTSQRRNACLRPRPFSITRRAMRRPPNVHGVSDRIDKGRRLPSTAIDPRDLQRRTRREDLQAAAGERCAALQPPSRATSPHDQRDSL